MGRRGRIFILIGKFNNFWSKFCAYFVQLFIPQYLTNWGVCAIIKTQRERKPLKTDYKGDLIMYSYNITAQEISDYLADMAEMAGEAAFLSDEEMEEMAKFFGEN